MAKTPKNHGKDWTNKDVSGGLEHNRPEPSQRSAGNLLKSRSSDPRCVILPIESLAGFGRNPDPVER
jgi:hypothetical protein